MRFMHGDKEYKLVFKHGRATSPPVLDRKGLKAYKKELREIMREVIPSLPYEHRADELDVALEEDGYTGPIIEWRTTSVFITDPEGIVSEIMTAVCDPFDKFKKETGRRTALNMLKRHNYELGCKAWTAYADRK